MKIYDHIWRFDIRLKQRLMRRWRRKSDLVGGQRVVVGIAIMAETYQLDAIDRAILQVLMVKRAPPTPN